MTSITRSALVMYSAEQMFDLVNDVRRYPEFLDGCKKTEVIDEGDDFIEARLTISKAGIDQSFSTHNRLVWPEKMEMQLLDGPFTRFHGIWHFHKLADDACKVSLDMEFEVANKITGMALSAVFKQVANMMVDAFVKRAKEIYG
ncbi:type II toxin-antitoxin system RatA family toxin [Oceanobacter mangrovi]|uniref:type II toxin-antitoxin system RatA family toxin n=1 Tax=Oceanobacter mangrovi TaxID=2862510 RepID=UPI001C8DF1AC|nr:type II toxin-antitoxin system RatA family toxin [Oceanobacter mangrovi]